MYTLPIESHMSGVQNPLWSLNTCCFFWGFPLMDIHGSSDHPQLIFDRFKDSISLITNHQPTVCFNIFEHDRLRQGSQNAVNLNSNSKPCTPSSYDPRDWLPAVRWRCAALTSSGRLAAGQDGASTTPWPEKFASRG